MSCSSSRWCHPTISSSVLRFSYCLQSFPASGSFLMSWLFHQVAKVLELQPSVLPMNIQNWFPLGLTGLISLQSKGLSRVFSNTTVQKHQFFGDQPKNIWIYACCKKKYSNIDKAKIPSWSAPISVPYHIFLYIFGNFLWIWKSTES